MADEADRYDPMAAGYARYWAPVLAPAVAELIELAEPRLAGARRILDVGTGTGQLALGVLKRWPAASVVGIDASSAMLEQAGLEAERHLGPRHPRRFERVTAPADSVPFPDGAFDAALSSFVFQLVPNRARALREVRRVLRPGGYLAYVAWLDDARRFRPDEIFDDLLDEAGIEPREADARPGDVPSVDRAAHELRRAGFAAVEARAGWVEHRFTVDGYIEFLTDFDEESLFAEMESPARERLLDRLASRLGRLSPEAMTMRYPIVFAAGVRSKR